MDGDGRSVRILIADDHPVLRLGLRTMLQSEPGFEVVGEATNGDEAIRLAQNLRPDVILLDLSMPRRSGFEVLRELDNLSHPAKILVLAASIDRTQMIEALQLGARGLLLKEAATTSLIDGIRAVVDGSYWVGRESVSDLVHVVRRMFPGKEQKAPRPNFGLTDRELEITAAVVAGYTNKEMALKFSLSEQTVKHHLTHIFDKLGASNRLEVALRAYSHHLVDDSG